MDRLLDEIHPGKDILIINDLQKDFLENGTLPTLRAKEIVPRIMWLANNFLRLKNVYLFGHCHMRMYFPGTLYSQVSHARAHEPIILAEASSDGEGSVKKTSQYGPSDGYSFEEKIDEFYFSQLKSEIHNRADRLSCPLMGAQFSVIQACKLDEQWLSRKVERIIFSGLHLDYCIMNEVAYLLSKKQFREVIVLSDASLSFDLLEAQATWDKLRKMGACVIHSNGILPVP